MTKTEKLYEFFNGFGLTAFPASAVPDNMTFPWLTYEATMGNFGDVVEIAVNLWYHTESEATPNAKVNDIANVLKDGGKLLICDDGAMWLRCGTPWALSLADENDATIKRRQLAVIIEFI